MLNKLEMLIALSKEQHFGRAAAHLGITQPTLSAGIRLLEDQFGVKLVHRGSRFGGLTPEGQRALIWARQIVGDARKMREEMRATRDGLSGHLRLAVVPTALTWASDLVCRVNQAYGNITFSVLSRSSTEILQMLDDLEIDAGLTYLDNEPLGRVTTVPLYQEHYVLICRPDHALAGQASVTWGQLATCRLCLLTPDMQNRRIINHQFQSVGAEPTALIESNSTVVLTRNVMNGDWATILPTNMAEFLVGERDLTMVPITQSPPCPTVGLVAQHQEPFTPVLQAFLDTARPLANL